jgi:hypothetical protein
LVLGYELTPAKVIHTPSSHRGFSSRRKIYLPGQGTKYPNSLLGPPLQLQIQGSSLSRVDDLKVYVPYFHATTPRDRPESHSGTDSSAYGVCLPDITSPGPRILAQFVRFPSAVPTRAPIDSLRSYPGEVGEGRGKGVSFCQLMRTWLRKV